MGPAWLPAPPPLAMAGHTRWGNNDYHPPGGAVGAGVGWGWCKVCAHAHPTVPRNNTAAECLYHHHRAVPAGEGGR